MTMQRTMKLYRLPEASGAPGPGQEREGHKLGNLGKGRGRVREENRLLHELEERAILRDKQMKSSLLQPRSDLKPLAHAQQAPLAACNLALPTNHSLPDVANPVPSPKPASVQEDAVAPAAGFRCT